MHTIRLLEVALEIATTEQIQVRRPNRAELLRIRSGELEYAELLERAEAPIQQVDAQFDASLLPNSPDLERIEKLLVEIRQDSYENSSNGWRGISDIN